MCERIFSLFGLVVADVLIINMWAVDVGRAGASNYNTLSDIFKVNLQLKFFDQITVKKLLFIIRDFYPEHNE